MKLLKLVPAETNINFLGMRRVAMVISCVLLLASAGLLVTRGLNLGIDFAGGVLLEVELQKPEPIADIRATLEALPIGETTIQEFGASEILLLRFVPEGTESNAAQMGITAVKEALADRVKDFRRTEMVGPSIGAELQIQALEAIGLALLLLMVYIWLRFEWQFSIGAILALGHDIILMLGFYALSGIEFNLSSIAALLTIAGYSINDTVVIYDRVREDIRRFKSTSFIDILNFAVNHTLSRTVMTSVTTLIALVSLAVFGGSIIQDFALALIVGVIAGTYSSVFLAVLFLLYAEPKRADMDNA